MKGVDRPSDCMENIQAYVYNLVCVCSTLCKLDRFVVSIPVPGTCAFINET